MLQKPPDLVDEQSATTSSPRSEADLRALIQVALDGLDRMRLADGTFCLELVAGERAPIGRSLRYSLMCAIGLDAATRAGYAHDLGGDPLRLRLLAEIDSPELTTGDLGLYLWLDALAGGPDRDLLQRRLETRLGATGGLEQREGLELAWIVQGLALSTGDGEAPALRAALATLLANQSPTGLFAHHGDARRRRRFPNFATEIYSILALARAAKLGLDDRAAPAALRAADRLLALQLPDGGWPWLYDIETGRVVEPYEIYSVHQHAMGPMGMLELFEATGERRFVEATTKGLEWIYGRNELERTMVDRERNVVYRSIRRRGALARTALVANAATATLTGRALVPKVGPVELNDTCRPYELGWLLEAWCGREHLAGETG